MSLLDVVAVAAAAAVVDVGGVLEWAGCPADRQGG